MSISRLVGGPPLRTRELRPSELAVLRDAVCPLVANKNLAEAEDELSALLRGAIIASLISSVIWVSVIVAVAWRTWPPHG